MSVRTDRRGSDEYESGQAWPAAGHGRHGRRFGRSGDRPGLGRGPGSEKVISLYHLHTREKGTFRFWRGDDHDYAGLAEIDCLLRDFRTGEIRQIDRVWVWCGKRKLLK